MGQPHYKFYNKQVCEKCMVPGFELTNSSHNPQTRAPALTHYLLRSEGVGHTTKITPDTLQPLCPNGGSPAWRALRTGANIVNKFKCNCCLKHSDWLICSTEWLPCRTGANTSYKKIQCYSCFKHSDWLINLNSSKNKNSVNLSKTVSIGLGIRCRRTRRQARAMNPCLMETRSRRCEFRCRRILDGWIIFHIYEI